MTHLPPGTTVLQVLPTLDSGGVERGTVEMAQAIRDAGARALVASAGGRLVPLVERAQGRHAKLPLDTKTPADFGVDTAPRLKTIKVSEPPVRSAGIKVADVDELVAKMKALGIA